MSLVAWMTTASDGWDGAVDKLARELLIDPLWSSAGCS